MRAVESSVRAELLVSLMRQEWETKTASRATYQRSTLHSRIVKWTPQFSATVMPSDVLQ